MLNVIMTLAAGGVIFGGMVYGLKRALNIKSPDWHCNRCGNPGFEYEDACRLCGNFRTSCRHGMPTNKKCYHCAMEEVVEHK